ncbi:hypothetical protein Zm00014a_021512 [Zea mays]|uniref:Uncharacterized protein n=1 Tax=Zea mays TaxID=4577 RepID=A0A3L6G921_MAIZE|nr:hypothetical protein Zm00014a_021512 [Zea mays]
MGGRTAGHRPTGELGAAGEQRAGTVGHGLGAWRADRGRKRGRLGEERDCARRKRTSAMGAAESFELGSDARRRDAGEELGHGHRRSELELGHKEARHGSSTEQRT